MNYTRKLMTTLAALGAITALWIVMTIGLVEFTLANQQREVVNAVLASRLILVGLSWMFGLGVMAMALRWLLRRYAAAPAKLLEQARVLLAAPKATPMNHVGTRETQALADVIDSLAQQRDALRDNVAEQIAQASQHVQQEKNRLAALMSELSQSVVVCNMDGRITLYNSRARLQFRALSQAPQLAGGAELIGIGRSIYAVLDRQLIAHALESVRQRMARGAVNPSAQIVTTTRSGQLLRVQVAPVRQAEAVGETPGLHGFVLMLDNVTKAFEEEHARDQQLHRLTEEGRSALASLQFALNMVAADPSSTSEQARAQAMLTLREQAQRLGENLRVLAQKTSQGLHARWPLEEMLGGDVLFAAQRRIEARTQRPVTLENLAESLWLKVDSFSLAQALEYLALRLVDEFDVRFLRLRLQDIDEWALLDLIWSGQVMSTETVMSWEMDAMRFGTESTPLTVRDVVARHGGELGFERERVRHEAFFRFRLPKASVQDAIEAQAPTHEARPEYYDFNLFATTEQTSSLDERRLSELAYTVFDTETTGLNPSQGDQILQIGATRIVGGRLLRQESFEQLVNPGCIIPAAGIPIHGITQDMVRGKPDIAAVLPAFHAFAQDSVLVAHNAAFDMKFLQLQEQATGLKFDHPVLDTLLLSAVVHPNQDAHSLEAIAGRFGVNVLGRHTALGDAQVTAEVFLRLIPLLQAQGIHTLGQAREAAQATYYARVKY
jgi:DNA polymerase-3 subunit epsilon